VLLAFFDPIKQRAMSGKFMAPGGHKILNKAINEVVQSFEEASRAEELGPKASHVLQQYQEQEVGLQYKSILYTNKIHTYIYSDMSISTVHVYVT
jgi:hypothetical protein